MLCPGVGPGPPPFSVLRTALLMSYVNSPVVKSTPSMDVSKTNTPARPLATAERFTSIHRNGMTCPALEELRRGDRVSGFRR